VGVLLAVDAGDDALGDADIVAALGEAHHHHLGLRVVGAGVVWVVWVPGWCGCGGGLGAGMVGLGTGEWRGCGCC